MGTLCFYIHISAPDQIKDLEAYLSSPRDNFYIVFLQRVYQQKAESDLYYPMDAGRYGKIYSDDDRKRENVGRPGDRCGSCFRNYGHFHFQALG